MSTRKKRNKRRKKKKSKRERRAEQRGKERELNEARKIHIHAPRMGSLSMLLRRHLRNLALLWQQNQNRVFTTTTIYSITPSVASVVVTDTTSIPSSVCGWTTTTYTISPAQTRARAHLSASTGTAGGGTGLRGEVISLYRAFIRAARLKIKDSSERASTLSLIRTRFKTDAVRCSFRDIQRIEYLVRSGKRKLEIFREARGVKVTEPGI